MKVTKNYIKQLVKEELRKVINEGFGNFITLDPLPRLVSKNSGNGGMDEELYGYAKSKIEGWETTQTIEQIIEVVRKYMERKGVSKEDIGRAVEDYAFNYGRDKDNMDFTTYLNFYKKEIQSKL